MQTAMERYVAASQQEVSQIYQHLQVPPPLVLDPSQFLDPKEDATNDNQEDATDVGVIMCVEFISFDNLEKLVVKWVGTTWENAYKRVVLVKAAVTFRDYM
ncbi:hypothetical protein Tco_1468771 [Tanacetum coccineum]